MYMYVIAVSDAWSSSSSLRPGRVTNRWLLRSTRRRISPLPFGSRPREIRKAPIRKQGSNLNSTRLTHPIQFVPRWFNCRW